jgi:hypothetical protein
MSFSGYQVAILARGVTAHSPGSITFAFSTFNIASTHTSFYTAYFSPLTFVRSIVAHSATNIYVVESPVVAETALFMVKLGHWDSNNHTTMDSNFFIAPSDPFAQAGLTCPLQRQLSYAFSNSMCVDEAPDPDATTNPAQGPVFGVTLNGTAATALVFGLNQLKSTANIEDYATDYAVNFASQHNNLFCNGSAFDALPTTKAPPLAARAWQIEIVVFTILLLAFFILVLSVAFWKSSRAEAARRGSSRGSGRRDSDNASMAMASAQPDYNGGFVMQMPPSDDYDDETWVVHQSTPGRSTSVVHRQPANDPDATARIVRNYTSTMSLDKQRAMLY